MKWYARYCVATRLAQCIISQTMRGYRVFRGVIGSAAASFLISAGTPAFAQWVNYPTAGVPRLSNGKPNLLAPAPRTSEGKPDLSGIWGWEDNRPCPPGGCPDQKVGQEFINIGWS